ncbi:MAG: tRNA (adenosine(37)-N6)-threonylcarbamoyltransferase complex ATPase subunit type 1 TsaE [bacterium]|nr:tRNA (adenosine(37)-N6)-threonylcarbamoyltransferase complex ATPase subunit type 1 TsaE [bacterium]
MPKIQTIISDSSSATYNSGLTFAKILKAGDKILLLGDIGSGKTTFVQGMARFLGITQAVQSPTFVLLKPYRIPKNRGKSKASSFIHLDLYRLGNTDDLQELGFAELLDDKKAIICIENPIKNLPFIGRKYTVSFFYLNQNRRKIRITLTK